MFRLNCLRHLSNLLWGDQELICYHDDLLSSPVHKFLCANVDLNAVEGAYFLLFVLSAWLYTITSLLCHPQTQQLLKLPPTYITSPQIPDDFYTQDEDWIFSKVLSFTTLDVSVCCLDTHRWLSGRKQFERTQPQRPNHKWQVRFGIYQPFSVVCKSGTFCKGAINFVLPLSKAATIVRKIAFPCFYYMTICELPSCIMHSLTSGLCIYQLK